METRELIKVNCMAVVLVREGDKVLREETTQPISCFSLEEMNDFYVKAKAEVDEMNLATKPNRKDRRGASRGANKAT